MNTCLIIAASILPALSSPPSAAADPSVYQADIDFALAEIPKHCGHFFDFKQIDWPAVSAQFKKEAAAVDSDQDHLVLLVRLLARLRDGHASVLPREKPRTSAGPTRPAGSAPACSGPVSATTSASRTPGPPRLRRASFPACASLPPAASPSPIGSRRA